MSGLNLLLKFPTFYIDQVSRISNYEVNTVAPPDTLFKAGESIIVDSVAVAEDKLLDQEGIAVPLEKAEATAYQVIDSTMTLAKAYKPSGAFARFVDIEASDSDSEGGSVRVGSEERESVFNRIDFSPHLRFDRVEGLYGEVAASASVSNFLRLRTALGFSTALEGSEKWSYEIGGRVDLDPAERVSLDVTYGKYNDTQWNSTPFLRTLNGAIVLGAGRDYFDYFRNERLRGMLDFEI